MHNANRVSLTVTGQIRLPLNSVWTAGIKQLKVIGIAGLKMAFFMRKHVN